MIELRPIRVPAARKQDIRAQFGALCYRIKDGKVQVLLVTGRRSGRWGLPKGWPLDGTTPAEAALREAWEEAGARGKVTGDCLGVYPHYSKGETIPRIVALYPVRVKRLETVYPEAGQRKRKWLSRKKAAARVLPRSPELAQIIRNFDPRRK